MIGILPAAGMATRMHGLPKFLLPTPNGFLLKRHVDAMIKAECGVVLVGANEDNHDLLFAHSARCSITHQVSKHDTMSQTVLSLYDTVIAADARDKPFMFGMPDTYIEDDHAYTKLANALRLGAQVAMGVFFTRPEQRHKLGMCEVYGTQVTRIVDKPQDTDLVLAWGVLAWQPVFWQYLQPEDPHVGYGVQRAIEAGVDVRAVALDGGYWDCGTPDEYFDLIAHLHTEKV